MKKFAVGFLSQFDNELKIEIIKADTWQNAVLRHSSVKPWRDDFIEMDSEKLQDWKEFAFDNDFSIDVVEVK